MLMLQIAGGVVLGFIALALLPTLLPWIIGAALVVGIPLLLSIATGSPVFLYGIPLLGLAILWRSEHIKKIDAESARKTIAKQREDFERNAREMKEQRQQAEARWYVDHGIDPVSRKPFPKDHPAWVAFQEKCDREQREWRERQASPKTESLLAS
jgi:hypothetical protein